MSTLTLATQVVRNPDLISTDMDGETVMMSIERGEYYGIGGVGKRAWELLAQPIRLQDLCQTICSEFEVDESRCQSDMLAFVSDLLQNGIVTSV